MIDKEFILDTLVNTEKITELQVQERIMFPSDLSYTLLKLNGLKLASENGYHILNNDGVEVVAFEQLIPYYEYKDYLDVFKEFEQDLGIGILDRFLPFAFTSSPIYLMIGSTFENLNQIVLWSFESFDQEDSPEREQVIAKDFIDFFNNGLVEIIY